MGDDLRFAAHPNTKYGYQYENEYEYEWYEYDYENGKYGDMTSISEEQPAEEDDAVTFLFVRMTPMLTSMSV